MEIGLPSCPRDATPLKLRLAGPSTFGVCERCHGLWVSGDQLQLYLESHDDAWNLPLGRPEELPETFAEGTINCPCSAMPMRVVNRDGVKVDCCAECGSVWLDGGELAALMKKNKPEIYQWSSSGDSPIPPGFEVVGDLALWEIVSSFVARALARVPWAVH